MKKFVCIVLLIALAVGFCTGCKKQRSAEEMWNSMIDQETVDEYKKNVNAGSKRLEAEMKGDTYCDKCDKVNPGKVRICKYCGQYI